MLYRFGWEVLVKKCFSTPQSPLLRVKSQKIDSYILLFVNVILVLLRQADFKADSMFVFVATILKMAGLSLKTDN